jgi:hypothetical protein
MGYINTHDRHFVYPVWLRIFTLVGVFAVFAMVAGPSYLFSSYDTTLPWNEQERISSKGPITEIHLSEDRPQLDNILRYKSEVEQDEQPRGEINILIYPDGSVKGIWNGEYDRLDDAHCLVMASNFSGSVIPDRKYVENSVNDSTKLYFFAAGAYNLFETEQSTKKQRSLSGFVYVRGWLDPNYLAVGELIITRDKKTCETFLWVSSPVK